MGGHILDRLREAKASYFDLVLDISELSNYNIGFDEPRFAARIGKNRACSLTPLLPMPDV